MTASISPSNATNQTLAWSSSNTSVATVSASGLITAISAGTATITATSQDGTNISSSCTVTVLAPVLITGISINPSTASILIGSTQQLTAAITPTNATNQSLAWSSSNTSVATVNSTGLVTAISSGTATITAAGQDGSKIASSCAITVNPIVVTGVSVSPTSASISVSGTQQLTATITPSNATNQNVTWSSNNTAVATVSSTGLVTGVTAGIATITATAQSTGMTATCMVTVNNTGFMVYFLDPSSWAKPAKVYWWDAVPSANLANATWPGVNMDTVGNNTSGWYKYYFANITSADVIFDDGTNQTANLSRSSNGWFMNSTWYNSDPSIVTGVSVSPTSVTLKSVGATQQLTPAITPSYAMNNTVTYSSSNNAVATVSSSGLITAVAAGSAIISVNTNQNGFTATCSVTVNTSNTIPVTSISVSPTSATLNVESEQQVTATVLPSNATNSSISWSSSNTSVATVSSAGLVQAISAGTAVIKASSEDGTNISASCTITVTNVTTYTIQNRWQTNTYLYDGGTGNVLYGTNPSSSAYQWIEVPVSGTNYIFLQNLATGNYINIQNLTGIVQCTAIQQTWWSAMWEFESAGSPWNYIENRWYPSDWIHIQDLKGYAEYAGANSSWWSAMWEIQASSSTTSDVLNESLEANASDSLTHKITVNIFPNPVLSGQQLNVSFNGVCENEA